MSLVHDLVIGHLPIKRRVTPRGWILHNAVCCQHRGHRPDTRMRGNLRVAEDGTMGGNCYNCGFKWRFDGVHISNAMEQYLGWLGVDRSQIQRAKMELMKLEHEGAVAPHIMPGTVGLSSWSSVDLPPGSVAIHMEPEPDDDPGLTQARDYLLSRGEWLAKGYDYLWSNSRDHDLAHRVILPFFYRGDTVGWTARWTGTPPPGKPKYFNSAVPEGYLFNWDMAEIGDRRFVVVTEGPFDAIAVQGVAAMGSTLSAAQIHNLERLDKRIIVLPDRQLQNQELIDTALTFGWSVSFPEWQEDVKDAAEACALYGGVYTTTSVIASAQSNPIAIGLRRHMFRG